MHYTVTSQAASADGRSVKLTVALRDAAQDADPFATKEIWVDSTQPKQGAIDACVALCKTVQAERSAVTRAAALITDVTGLTGEVA